MSLMASATILPLALSLAAQAADPQPALADPTRPPTVAPGARDGAASVAGAGAPRLQSILISPQRRLAVIDGRTVALGGKVDQATLVQIAETYVILREGTELRTLELYPGVTRQAIVPGMDNKKEKLP
jgi:MSHA biogenesis protein MshK